MPENPIDTELFRMASDPATPKGTLADLAYDNPTLRVAIAMNPSTYPGLLEWLAELGEADIDAGIAARDANRLSAAAGAPSEIPDSGPASVVPPVAFPDPTTIARSPRALAEASASSVESAGTPPTCSKCRAPLGTSASFCGTCGMAVAGGAQTFSGFGTPTRSRSTVLFATILTVAVFLIFGGGVATAAGLSASTGGDESQSSTQDDANGQASSGDVSQSQPSTGSQTSIGTSQPTAQPSPSIDPAQSVAFRSKSGNITCVITPDAALCNQKLIHYGRPAAACDSGIGGVTVGVDQQGADWPCLDQAIVGAVEIPYDHSVSRWGFACAIDLNTGVKCTNQTGDGFTMEYNAGVSTF